MLTEEEAKAVERLRNEEDSYTGHREELYLDEGYFQDLFAAQKILNRLYPPGWNEPVTPERLVEIGGVVNVNWVNFDKGIAFYIYPLGFIDVVANDIWLSDFNEKSIPRNMKEARELLERCGAIKEGNG